tara:strand:- start:2 stop:1645 length:1644 start_codon:yes stop_codon:yes gene_type:complete
MSILVFLLSVTLLSSQKYDLDQLHIGKRGGNYRVWIYFEDKPNSKPIILDQKTILRREKSKKTTRATWFDLNVSKTYIDHLNMLGFQVLNQSRWLNAVTLICNKDDIELLSTLEFVKKIVPVNLMKKKRIEENNLAGLSRTFIYGNSNDQMEQINAIDAQSMGFYGQGVRILYIDTGFDLSHEAFDSLQVVGQYDFINDDQITSNENEEEEQNNQDEHGSLCLSVLSGFKEGELIGPAFKSEFLLAKTEIVDQEIEQEEDNYVAALEWGEGSGADIACASLGYIDWYNYQDLDGNTSPTTIAVDIASSLGVLCVNSAGNSGDDSWYYIMAPADADSVLSIGSVTSEGVLSSFSSHGPTYDGRIKPEVCARGSSTYCIRPGTNSEYRYASGTSLSAPLAAGAAAIVLSANPSWNAMNVREAIMKTASMSELPNNDYGYGILNTVEALEYDFNLLIDKSNFSPEKYTLEVFPNPFNPSLNIRLSDLTGQAVNVDIFSMNGRFITSLIQNRIIKTSSTIDWTPANQSSGIYFLRINVNGRLNYQKVTFIK